MPRYNRRQPPQSQEPEALPDTAPQPEPQEPGDNTDGTPPPASIPDTTQDIETEEESLIAKIAAHELENLEPVPDSPPIQLPETVSADAPTDRQPQLPIHIELPTQCRRVREQVLPAWYLARYTHPDAASGVADARARLSAGFLPLNQIADQIMTINAALSTADQAMMNQDVGQMIFITRILQTFRT